MDIIQGKNSNKFNSENEGGEDHQVNRKGKPHYDDKEILQLILD